MEVPRDVYIHHIYSGHHDLGGRLAVEVDDVFEELLLFGLMPFEEIDGLRQFIDREVIALRLHTPCQETCRAHEEGGERL